MQSIINSISIILNKYPKLVKRNAILYYLRIELNNICYYKLGYTTTSLHERVYGRYGKHNGMGLPVTAEVYIIAIYRGNANTIYQYEQYLHQKYQPFKYTGSPIMANGNSELYTTDILDLDY
jgi:hypothetical protein